MKKENGYPGEIIGENIFCPLYKDWIGRIVSCQEICDSRGDYLNAKSENKILSSASSFNQAAKHGGFVFPEDITEAINLCLFCEAKCQEDVPVKNIPSKEDIDRDCLLSILYG